MYCSETTIESSGRLASVEKYEEPDKRHNKGQDSHSEKYLTLRFSQYTGQHATLHAGDNATQDNISLFVA